MYPRAFYALSVVVLDVFSALANVQNSDLEDALRDAQDLRNTLSKREREEV
jgi:hypothetical protein